MGLPLSEAALRRRRRQRRRVAAFAFAEAFGSGGGSGGNGSSGGVQDPYTSAVVPGGSGVGGGCCGGGPGADGHGRTHGAPLVHRSGADGHGCTHGAPGDRGGSLGSQSSLTGTYVPGGCCEGEGFQDVRQHVVMALRCLAGALEIQGYDWGQFAYQQYWTEDTGGRLPRHYGG